MAVIINDFEVVAEPPAQPRRGSDAPPEAAPAHPVEPRVIAPALRALGVQSLRVWAH